LLILVEHEKLIPTADYFVIPAGFGKFFVVREALMNIPSEDY